ncbi:MAG: saccharopine dehydrogenase NADP-binding domain-containing protein [Ichthyobacteriaceae bacterium]|nr:saccharopine dehydrogenase NADP-binding domain-containing protein [Ichthyobacteriaceae bacterium]
MKKRNVLIIGAGRSTVSLVEYMLDVSEKENLIITVGDIEINELCKTAENHKNGRAIVLDVFNDEQRSKEIQNSDLVISMIPARFHQYVAVDCVKFKKHMVTPSYVSNEMKELSVAAIAAGIVIMNEVGVDPGIDHMSAKKVIDNILDEGGKMLSFESFTGGLVAPGYDDNIWKYKFTWNPRNVVLAGQGGAAKFIQEGKYKYIPYHKVFRRTEVIDIPGYGKFEAYANRDSLAYRNVYELEGIPTIYRGTFRRIGYSRAWNIFVDLGLTDDGYVMENTENMTYRDFINSFLPYHPYNSVEIKLRHYLKIDQDDIVWEKLVCLGLFSKDKFVNLKKATPAQVLEKILSERWALKSNDHDMIVMYHRFGYELNGVKKQTISYMVTHGKDSMNTAMARTVGLPAAITGIKILNGEISTPGIHVPINKEVYEPVLKELEKHDIEFIETTSIVKAPNPDVLV